MVIMCCDVFAGAGGNPIARYKCIKPLLHTVNLYNVMCQLDVNKPKRKKERGRRRSSEVNEFKICF